MHRSLILTAAVLIAVFALYARLPAAQTASPAFRVYPYQNPDLITPQAKDRSLVQFQKVAIPAKFRGEFVIDTTVGVDGRVTDALVKEAPSGSAASEAALLASMSEWTYEPGRLHDVTVPVRMELRLGFEY